MDTQGRQVLGQACRGAGIRPLQFGNQLAYPPLGVNRVGGFIQSRPIRSLDLVM